MNKVSLLAASVAIALTGCGGSDSGSSSASNGVVITGFDGYFKNAVVFEDTNNNGQWDTQESILGLTDEKGQLTLAAKPEKTLALQTLVPNGAKQKQLIALDAKKYAGTYTVDMDHPSQAMAHEIVFRAPSSSNVISPITDLVAIEMAKDPSITEEDAKANVNKALGGSEEAPIDLYSDFVEGATKNAELHKTAQILTESKAQNPTNYEKKATEFAQAANQEVDRLVASGENINDPSLRPVITDSTPNSDNLAPETLVNNKLTVNETVEDAAEDKLDKLPEIVKGAAFDGVELNIEGLFKDKDQSLVSTKLTHNLAGTGIEVEQVGNLIVLHPTAIVEKSGDFEIVLTAQDKNSNGDVLSTVSTVFEIEIESANLPPMVVEAEQARLQSIVDGWYLQQGELFEQTLDISGLFQDKDGQITDYSADYVGIEGLSAIEDGNAIVTIKGTPTKAGESGAALTISATDGHTAVQIALSMP
ncbi:putative acid phosphatase, partial [Vibrio parahaemolyticus IDH02640]